MSPTVSNWAKALVTAALLATSVDGLVFKAVNHCSNSVPPVPGRLRARQEFCDPPYLVGFADDGTQLTFNGGTQQYGLIEKHGVGGGPCYETSGDYDGAPIGVDKSDGHYPGGLLNFRVCNDGSSDVSTKGCVSKINGMENTKSTSTNCNGCKGGFFSSCNCCANTY